MMAVDSAEIICCMHGWAARPKQRTHNADNLCITHFIDTRLANVLNLLSAVNAGAKVPCDVARKALHHHGKQAARERRVPAALGRLVADERVLRLDLHELSGVRTWCVV